MKKISLLLLPLIVLSSCKRDKPIARVPVSSIPSNSSYEPAPEIENQATSAPTMGVEILPEPSAPPTVVQPELPVPVPQPVSPPRKTRAGADGRREVRTNPSPPVPARSDPPPVPPAIQLAPQISESEKVSLTQRIRDQLSSARLLIRGVKESDLNQDQKTNLIAIQDFIKKAEDAISRGEFYQSLVLAQKANTLATSMPRTP
ncbi:MAG: hypothetical protein AB1898_26990 [Acidobacteriota bacterium]